MPLPNLRAILERWNRDRRRLSPRVLRAVWDNGGDNITLYFDRKMDTRTPVGTSITVFDGVNERWVQFAGNTTWASGPERLSSDDVTDQGSYTGPTYIVITRAGNLREERRFKVWNNERCDRVELA